MASNIDSNRLQEVDVQSAFELLELSLAAQSRARHWLQLGHSATTLSAAIIEAVHYEHEPKRIHATTVMKLLRVEAVNFCKQLSRFIDELYAELSDIFISEAKEFVGKTIQLWVLYCKYRSLFEANWNLSDQNHTSTLFTCGWLLFLAVRSEVNASWKMTPDLLYRYYTLINAIIFSLGMFCPPEAKKLTLTEIDKEVLGACHSLVTVVVERLSEEGIWFQNDLIRSVAGLGRHIDRVICSSDEVWQCWLLDGRVFFSDDLRGMCERTLQLGLSPIIRSPSKRADSSPACLMPSSVKWLLKLADDASWPSSRVLQHWPSYTPDKLEHLVQQHCQRPFSFGSNDAMVVSHRFKVSVLVFYRLLEALVDQEASRRAEDHVALDFSKWLDSTSFIKVTLYLATQVVIGCYKIPILAQDQLASVFDVTPLESIAALRNVLKTPLIDDQSVRIYLFSIYEQFVLIDAWKDKALSNPHLNGHVRSLYRAGHSFALDAIQFLSRNFTGVGDLSGCALSVINQILQHQAELLIAPLGLDAVVVCTLYGLSKLSEACTIKLIPTYKLLMRHRSVGSFSLGPVGQKVILHLLNLCNDQDLLRFYNDSFVPVMKTTLISVSEQTAQNETSVNSSDSSLAVTCMYKA